MKKYEFIDNFIFDSLEILESGPCTNGKIRAYCISHDIIKVREYDIKNYFLVE